MAEPTLKEGTHGSAVVTLQRSLNGHGAVPKLVVDGVFGSETHAAVIAFQKSHRLQVDGVVGEHTWEALGFKFPARTETMAEFALWYAHYNRLHPGVLHYDMIRPMTMFHRLPAVVTHSDCSEFATLISWLARRPDPNGLGYDGYGNTDTLREHGSRVPVSEAGNNCLAHYSNPDHVAVCVGGGAVVSWGHEGDPTERPIGYRSIYEVRSY